MRSVRRTSRTWHEPVQNIHIITRTTQRFGQEDSQCDGVAGRDEANQRHGGFGTSQHAGDVEERACDAHHRDAHEHYSKDVLQVADALQIDALRQQTKCEERMSRACM